MNALSRLNWLEADKNYLMRALAIHSDEMQDLTETMQIMD